MRNKYLRLFTRSQDHDARIIYKKVNRLIFHTGFFLIFFLYSYFVLIVYLYFCFVFFSLCDTIFAFFVTVVVLKKFAKVTQLNLLINIEYLFLKKSNLAC